MFRAPSADLDITYTRYSSTYTANRERSETLTLTLTPTAWGNCGQLTLLEPEDHVWFYCRPSPSMLSVRITVVVPTLCVKLLALLQQSRSLLHRYSIANFNQNVGRVVTRCCIGIQTKGNLFTAFVTLTLTRGSPL